MTEKKIQNFMFAYLQAKAHELIVPNCGVYGWEADLVSATPRGYGHEYEIKISRADFKADKKKRAWSSKGKGSKTQALKNPVKRNPGPTYFWYCVPKDLIKKSEIPAHAGLIYVSKKGIVTVVKKAPKLHALKINTRQTNYINRGLMIRYWKGRK